MTLFALIVVVVVDIGVQKWRGIDRLEERENRTWALTYWFLAAFMSAGAVGIYAAARSLSHGFSSHRTFILEAWMIGWLAIFWLLQTWERRTDGAPQRTNAELDRLASPTGSGEPGDRANPRLV